MHPAPIVMADRTWKEIREKLFCALCLVSIAYWRRGTFVRQYSHRLTVRCASPIFKPIAYKLGFTNRKRKYFEEQTTATVKIKQTSIATVRNHILTVACFLTPFFFHYPLPLKNMLTCPFNPWKALAALSLEAVHVPKSMFLFLKKSCGRKFPW
jgi:hypothetical protein